MAFYSFPKKDRLCNSKRIETLFSEGERFFEFPFKALWLEDPKSTVPLKLAISVPKKRVAKATDRNHIKRLVREAFRIQKLQLIDVLNQKNKKVNLMLVYSFTSILSLSDIEDKISVTLRRLADEV